MSKARVEHASMFVRLASLVSLAAWLSVTLGTSSAQAQMVSLDFETYPGGAATASGEILTSQYQAVGVSMFDGSPQIEDAGFPPFAQGRGLFVDNPSSAVTITFSVPVSRVRLNAAATDGRGTFTAFDAFAEVVDTQVIEPTNLGGDTYEVSGSGIASVQFVAGFGAPDSFFIDQLEFGDGCTGDEVSGDRDGDGICNDRDDRLMVLTEAFTDTRGACGSGGVEITVGVDRDASGTLSEPERWGSANVCHGPAGPEGLEVRFATTEILATDPRCPSGGVELKLGIDDNRNDVLDQVGLAIPAESEVDVTHVICAGMYTVAAAWPEGASETCSSGGIRVAIGLDENGNGVLDDVGLAGNGSESEVETSELVCHGSDSLIRVTPVSPIVPQAPGPPTLSTECPKGGLHIAAGTDRNGNDWLDAEEASVDSELCHGLGTVVLTSEIEPGDERCEGGGYLVRAGLDQNDDGAISVEEQTLQNALCHGHNSVASITEIAPDPDGCVSGGVELAAGTDADGDGALGDGERTFTRAVCHGQDTLIVASTIDVDTIACPQGGVKIEAGVDASGDGRLRGEEVRSSETVCNGFDSLVKTVSLAPDPGLCPSGGLLVLLGNDRDGDAVLDDAEIDTQYELCHGEDTLAVVSPVAPGADHCPLGGARLQTGPDTDADGVLDDSEIADSQTLCAGLSTLSRASTVSPNPDQCVRGGVKLEYGLDSDGNGVLDDGEVISMEIICGGNGLAVRMRTLEAGSAECPLGGSLLETGIDVDADGELDEEEIQNSDPLCQPAEFLFTADPVPVGDRRCPHGGLRLTSGFDDGDPDGTAGDGELQRGEVELDRKVCLPTTQELIDGSKGQCAVRLPGRSGGGGTLTLSLLIAAGLLLRRRRRSP